MDEACLSLLEKARADEYELVTLYIGADLPRAEANRVADIVREKYPEQEVEVQDGGQPHYQLIISIE